MSAVISSAEPDRRPNGAKSQGVFTAVSNADYVAQGMLHTSMKRPTQSRGVAEVPNTHMTLKTIGSRAGPDLVELARISLNWT